MGGLMKPSVGLLGDAKRSYCWDVPWPHLGHESGTLFRRNLGVTGSRQLAGSLSTNALPLLVR
jgi:hypothetical protein